MIKTFFALLSATPGAGIVALVLSAGIFAAGAGTGYMARGVIEAPKLSGAQKETAEAQRDTARAERDTAVCQGAHEKARADGAEGVIGALRGSIDGVNAAAARLDRLAAARETATQKFLRELANAPKSFICGASEPELAYRRSVQPQAQPGTAPTAP